MSLSSDDDAVLSRMGMAYLYNFVSICPLLILYGAFLTLFPYSLYIIRRRPLKTVASRWIVVFTTILFLCDTIFVACIIAFQALEYQDYLIAPKYPLDSRRQLFIGRTARLDQVQFVVQNTIFIIADAIVLWRSWVVFGYNKVVRAFIVMVGSVNSLLLAIDIVINCLDTVDVTLSTASLGTIDFTAYLFSFLANLCATLLIGYRLWQHRRNMKHLGRHKRSTVEKVLVLIIETGVGFCVIQMINAVIAITSEKVDSQATNLFGDVWLNIRVSPAQEAASGYFPASWLRTQ